ncbi:MAG: putative sugar nucleotidyl transferase [Candidatus Zixiibacteriota bacterium]
MSNKLIVFEDTAFASFFPVTLNRPVFFLRCGALALWEKIARRFPDYSVSFACRDEITGLVRRDTGKRVNHIDYQPGDRLVFVNGALRLGDKLTKELQTIDENVVYLHNNKTAAMVITQPLSKNPGDVQFTGEAAADAIGTEAKMADGEFEFYFYLWDLVHNNSNEIAADFVAWFNDEKAKKLIKAADVDDTARILSDENFYIAPDAAIHACCVIDNTHGPVIVDSKAVIGPLSYVQGPCYIGPGTQIFRANVREGCSFGPTCRVGGEVEESIFQGFTNKYHDGFMGHAYLGSWVNLGAMTTNSDLKNNYKNIAVSVNGSMVDSGYNKIGCMVGDHTKTGIGTLINTGVNIGFSCNIFGGSLVTSREVPSFSWGDETGYDLYRVEKAIEVAKIVMPRRGVPFTDDDDKIFRAIFDNSTADRVQK